MLKKIIILFLLIIPLLASAQYKRQKSMKGKRGNLFKKSKIQQKEWIIGVGAANFLGELGGANQIGTNFVKDFEVSMTRPSAQVGYRYKFRKRWAVKGGIYWQWVSGADRLTKEPFRENRNLSFRSNIFELSGQAEFFLTKAQKGHLYKIKKANASKSFHVQAYVFVGFGAFLFNPKARYDGKWVALQPLSTEGQGLPGGPKKYSRASFVVPYGIGFKNALTSYPEFTVGFEIGMRKTFTDYIDDVSTVYYDNKALLAAKGKKAAALADPSLFDMPGVNVPSGEIRQSGTGYQRGDKKDLDAYMFINITFSYTIPTSRARSKF